MDPIKEAFLKIKEEIISLKSEINHLNNRILNMESQQSSFISRHSTDTPTHFPTLPQEMKGFRQSFSNTSTGNEGVPTDNLTNKPTDQQTNNLTQIKENYTSNDSFLAFERAKLVLDSLDNIKKEIRIKFKKLTNKEMIVFSTIYSLEEREIDEITYKLIANHLNLTESSIRDYVNRLIQKGIPLNKSRMNNKTIRLHIDDNFKNIVSLQTLIKLREL